MRLRHWSFTATWQMRISMRERKERNNMKLFEEPIMEIATFTVQDIVTTSDGEGGIGGDYEMPEV